MTKKVHIFTGSQNTTQISVRIRVSKRNKNATLQPHQGNPPKISKPKNLVQKARPSFHTRPNHIILPSNLHASMRSFNNHLIALPPTHPPPRKITQKTPPRPIRLPKRRQIRTERVGELYRAMRDSKDEGAVERSWEVDAHVAIRGLDGEVEGGWGEVEVRV